MSAMTIAERTKKLQFLIHCLQVEMPEYAHYRASDDPQEAFDLYRALCNVRMPQGHTGHTLPKEFYTVQAEVLQDITRAKGITNAKEIPSSKRDARLALWQGDN